MKKIIKMVAMVLLLGLVGGCDGMTSGEQRMLSGGAIGAGAGAAVGAISGGSATTGAVIGGAAGAVGGAMINQMESGHGH